VAENGACRVEHTAPPEVISHMISFIEFLKICPRGGDDLLKGFADYCKEGKPRTNCNACLSGCHIDNKLLTEDKEQTEI